MGKIDAIDKQIKFSAFGKTRTNKNKDKKKLEEGKEKNNEDLLRRSSLEEEIIKIKSLKLGNVGSIFKMKEVITGPKKGGQEPIAIRDPKDVELVVSNKEIKKVTLAYCVDNLTRKSDDDIAQLRNELNEMRMEEKGEKGFEIIRKDFDDVVKKFGSKSTKSYDFLLKAGVRYQNAIFKLCKKMVEQLQENSPLYDLEAERTG